MRFQRLKFEFFKNKNIGTINFKKVQESWSVKFLFRDKIEFRKNLGITNLINPS